MSKRRKRYNGLAPETFPQSVRWKVDQDYTDELSDAEAQWLADFNDCYYGADFRSDKDESWTREERRKVYRDKNRANREAVNHNAEGFEADDVEDEAGANAASQATPAYLNSEEYKKRLAAYREALPEPRKPAHDDLVARRRALEQYVDEEE